MVIFKSILILLFFLSYISLIISAEICEPGYTFSKQDGCIPCKAGMYSPEDEKCEKCPLGTYSLSASSKCEKCLPGTVSTEM